jgi:methanol--5-hydroxybenzimidazolylcobamide Co-methyltransferase
MKYKKLALEKPKDLIFGTAPHPVTTKRGLEIGGGDVYPELNFTLPAISINEANMPEIRRLKQVNLKFKFGLH